VEEEAELARPGGPRPNYAVGIHPEPATLDRGNSSTDHGHAVSAREYQTDSSSKRPAPLHPSVENEKTNLRT